jgi:hypothetical protein
LIVGGRRAIRGFIGLEQEPLGVTQSKVGEGGAAGVHENGAALFVCRPNAVECPLMGSEAVALLEGDAEQ